MRLVVVISGEGRNLQALIDACAAGQIAGRIERVIANRPDAPGLARAAAAGIPGLCIAQQDYPERVAFDRALAAEIEASRAQAVLLAGFMRILSTEFVDQFQGRLLNIHPSLLPKHRGLHTHRRVLQAGDAEHGATVHFVTPELDGGPAVICGAVAVHPRDTEVQLAERVMTEVEQIIYPQAVAWFASRRLVLGPRGPLLDGTLLDKPIRFTKSAEVRLEPLIPGSLPGP